MDREPSYFLIQGEKRQLNGKELFSFLRENIQPGEVAVCGAPMAFLKLPEFIPADNGPSDCLQEFDDCSQSKSCRTMGHFKFAVPLLAAGAWALKKPRGIWKKIKNKLYEALLNRKMEKLLAVTTEEFPLIVLEACLAEFLKKECAFRRATKVLIADRSRVDFKELLMPYCSSLNYLEFLVDDSEAYEYLAEEMYEESGLTVAFTASGELGERYHIVMDVRNDLLIPAEYLAEGCVYFDAFSDLAKEKYLRREGKGITYLSPRIYLDRALKSTV